MESELSVERRNGTFGEWSHEAINIYAKLIVPGYKDGHKHKIEFYHNFTTPHKMWLVVTDVFASLVLLDYV